MNEERIRAHLDARLSGLTASDARRNRIRAAVRIREREDKPMKRKLPLTLAFALMIVALASIAIAEGLNLFDFFGKNDERYRRVASEAVLPTTAPVQVAGKNTATAVIENAYFDGMTLSLALRIDQPTDIAAYTPTEEEMARMTPAQASPVVLEPDNPANAIYQAWNEALQGGVPFGYREWTLSPSDHTYTDDGIDLPPTMGNIGYNEAGAFLELREYESPLPEAVQTREVLNLRIPLRQSVTMMYFDGENAYCLTERLDAGDATASIPRAAIAPRTLTGEGTLFGVPCRVTAEVSPMTATVTLVSDVPLENCLPAAPEGVAPSDAWVEMTARDQAGRALRPTGGADIHGCEVVAQFNGTGELPETLTIALQRRWEGADESAAPGTIVLK